MFGLAAGVLVTLSMASFSSADDKKESALESIMEKVQKHNGVITKGTRNAAAYKKAQKDVEESAKELAKLAEMAKPIKDSLSKAKDVADPQAAWNEFCDHFRKSSDELSKLVAKSETTQAEAKAAFGKVKKSCTECHSKFRTDDE
jgi:cytochrome c556